MCLGLVPFTTHLLLNENCKDTEPFFLVMCSNRRVYTEKECRFSPECSSLPAESSLSLSNPLSQHTNPFPQWYLKFLLKVPVAGWSVPLIPIFRRQEASRSLVIFKPHRAIPSSGATLRQVGCRCHGHYYAVPDYSIICTNFYCSWGKLLKVQ